MAGMVHLSFHIHAPLAEHRPHAFGAGELALLCRLETALHGRQVAGTLDQIVPAGVIRQAVYQIMSVLLECSSHEAIIALRLTARPVNVSRHFAGKANPVSSAGLPKRAWVKFSQIRTLSVPRIGKRVARVTPEKLAKVIEGLNEIIGG